MACRLFAGSVKPGDLIRLLSNGETYKVQEVGFFELERKPQPCLLAGSVGYITAGIKKLGDIENTEKKGQ